MKTVWCLFSGYDYEGTYLEIIYKKFPSEADLKNFNRKFSKNQIKKILENHYYHFRRGEYYSLEEWKICQN